MLSGMSKKEISIFFILVGIVLGMSASVFLEYSLKMENITKYLSTSCTKDSVDKIRISFFGKFITVECKNGEVHNFKNFTP